MASFSSTHQPEFSLSQLLNYTPAIPKKIDWGEIKRLG